MFSLWLHLTQPPNYLVGLIDEVDEMMIVDIERAVGFIVLTRISTDNVGSRILESVELQCWVRYYCLILVFSR